MTEIWGETTEIWRTDAALVQYACQNKQLARADLDLGVCRQGLVLGPLLVMKHNTHFHFHAVNWLMIIDWWWWLYIIRVLFDTIFTQHMMTMFVSLHISLCICNSMCISLCSCSTTLVWPPVCWINSHWNDQLIRWELQPRDDPKSNQVLWYYLLSEYCSNTYNSTCILLSYCCTKYITIILQSLIHSCKHKIFNCWITMLA